jgi:hypothetical protein
MSRIPPLPEPVFLWDRPEYPHFTADQLRARDRLIVEACATLCDEWAAEDMPGAVLGRTLRLAAALRSLLGEGEGK